MHATTEERARLRAAEGGHVRTAVTALLPAHNEEAGIAAAVASLRRQTEPPGEIVVIADNCTDPTEQIARDLGVSVFPTEGNVHKKAGALNQALAALDPQLADDDLVLVMDADSLLDPGFLAAARRALEAPDGSRRARGGARLGGVGGTFLGGPGGGLVGVFQRNEYARYARDVRRLQGRALVLTGTASVFPMRVLREVARARREGRLPDKSGAGAVYDVHVLTEDNELSLALMHLGYGILAPGECTLETEVMQTWGDLARQRSRWKRGALENIVDYGFTRVTAPYWGRQLLSALGVLATLAYVASLVVGLIGGWQLHPFWLAVSLVFVLERVVTVRRRGWPQMLLAAPLVIEMVYDLFLQVVQARAFYQVALRREKRW
ncbi:MAG TPA: glycosyltransferase family 2 protein [Nocardioides sp.]|uniref:glycosyltransferase n=1 Tax=Nocardioides sp. TaxID=35761 RepID=UPI002E338679|nr:glycosyltransferase family 2 protein [Nocardioides sp.]HEX5088156.1 glycosyltransferase family 2 protein [Nocardioides sp.]